jgi:hypothetical protein
LDILKNWGRIFLSGMRWYAKSYEFSPSNAVNENPMTEIFQIKF